MPMFRYCFRCGHEITPQLESLGRVGSQMDYHGAISPDAVGSYNFGQIRSPGQERNYSVCRDCWIEIGNLQPFNEGYTMHCRECIAESKKPGHHQHAFLLSPGGEIGEHKFHLWGWVLCPSHWKVCKSWLMQSQEGRVKTGRLPNVGDIVEALDSVGDWVRIEVVSQGRLEPEVGHVLSFQAKFLDGKSPLLLTVGHWNLKDKTESFIGDAPNVFGFYQHGELAWWRHPNEKKMS